jgi:hypothetical protein
MTKRKKDLRTAAGHSLCNRPPAGLHKKAPPAGLHKVRRRLAIPRGATLRKQLVQCGKAGCRKWHGPYWYAFWKVDGRTRSAYVGSDRRMRELVAERERTPL